MFVEHKIITNKGGKDEHGEKYKIHFVQLSHILIISGNSDCQYLMFYSCEIVQKYARSKEFYTKCDFETDFHLFAIVSACFGIEQINDLLFCGHFYFHCWFCVRGSLKICNKL
ncbi:hypothetical protein AMECASPLE_030893 [Ameca splendens]|uniref:Uncharacterized protein n=1 Tax=Ameca splendens TaxID=208324 RepID=A0ABV0ZFB8_9TELE